MRRAVFGLTFGEWFVVCFVLVTVVGAPYAGPLAERIARLLLPNRPGVDVQDSKANAGNALGKDD
jgi:hypothetical protein